jgi:hypothetical protein
MQCVPWTQGSRSDTKQITDRQMSVRPNWLRRRLVPAETDLNQWLSTARPEAVTAWQALDSHLKVVAAIGHITAEFDCRTAPFRMITSSRSADNFKLDDRAVMATGGPIEADSALFRRPGTHRLILIIRWSWFKS